MYSYVILNSLALKYVSFEIAKESCTASVVLKKNKLNYTCKPKIIDSVQGLGVVYLYVVRSISTYCSKLYISEMVV